MKRRDYILIVLVLAVLAGVWILLEPAPAKIVPAISLELATNSPIATKNEFTFWLKNSDHREIFLSEIFVDVKRPAGWVMVNHITPKNDQVVHPGETKDLTSAPPNGSEPWRLRIAYGPQIQGVRLFLMKLIIAAESGKYPGNGFGAFSGSNSLSSAEIQQ